jgi:hypothetical protein
VATGSVRCPPDELMCGDPGLLTCTGALNDCSGRGDCLKGRCYCHTGFGGADCSVDICTSTCADVGLRAFTCLVIAMCRKSQVVVAVVRKEPEYRIRACTYSTPLTQLAPYYMLFNHDGV